MNVKEFLSSKRPSTLTYLLGALISLLIVVGSISAYKSYIKSRHYDLKTRMRDAKSRIYNKHNLEEKAHAVRMYIRSQKKLEDFEWKHSIKD